MFRLISQLSPVKLVRHEHEYCDGVEPEMRQVPLFKHELGKHGLGISQRKPVNCTVQTQMAVVEVLIIHMPLF